jgi:hypothetical protein
VPHGLDRVARSTVRMLPPERMRPVRVPAVYWDGELWRPAWVLAWCRMDGQWFVRMRMRRDMWRDAEAWFHYERGLVLPVGVDGFDVNWWLPRRPLG